MPASGIKNILVVGGFGFIGAHLANFYKNQDYNVYRTSRYFEIQSDKFSFNIDYSYQSFLNIFKKTKFDIIFSLSGNPYPSFSETNPVFDIEQSVLPALNLMKALVDSKYKGTFWYGSSVAVYGKTSKKKQSESDICKPLSSYALTKLMIENYVKQFSNLYNMHGGSFRIFSTFGEGLERQIIYDLYKKSINPSSCLELIGSGREKRDISHVDDQVKRMAIIASKVIPNGDVYNIGSGCSMTTMDIAKSILEILKIEKEIVIKDPIRTFDGSQWEASMKKFEKIQRNPKSNFKKSLERTLSSYQVKNV